MAEATNNHSDPTIGKVLSSRPFSVSGGMIENYLGGLGMDQDSNETPLPSMLAV